MKKILGLMSVLFISFSAMCANGIWHGKQAAVVLTYDDALADHLDHVLPVLDRYNMRGTFYITVNNDGFKKRLNDWRFAALEGHELGNHTLYHPCDASLAGREWVSKEADLSKWSKYRFMADVGVANTTLEAIDGKKRRTFAYTCGDTKAGGESFLSDIAATFPAARGVQWGTDSLEDADLSMLKTISVMNNTTADLTAQVDLAIKQHRLLVFLFHGVDSDYSINVSQEAHDGLIKYLNKHRQDVWVAPMLEVADYIKAQR